MSFEFAEPWFLLLSPVPILLWLWRRRSRRAALRFPSERLFAGLPTARVPRFVGELFRTGALLGLVFALAGPRQPDLKTRIPTVGIAIVFVLDTSGSMQDATFLWDGPIPIARAEAARRALHLFIAGGDGPDGTHFDGRSTENGTDAVGLITFTNWPHPVCPPTLNHSVLLNILDRVPPPTARDTGTNIGDALAEGVLRLDQTTGQQKVIILLSDGEHNLDFQPETGRQPLKPRQAAALAKNLGIKIYTIDAGGDPPLNDPDAAKRRLDGRHVNEQVAEMTEGRAFTANDGAQLLEVCRQIDAMERQPAIAPVYRRYHEYYPWLALIAFALAGLTFGLEQTIWRRIP